MKWKIYKGVPGGRAEKEEEGRMRGRSEEEIEGVDLILLDEFEKLAEND
jgi:hypothetical protein